MFVNTRGVSNKELMVVLMFIVIINFVLFMFYKQYLKQELDKDLRV